jgi:predicted acetyltransferase
MTTTIRRSTIEDFDRIFHLARSAFPIQPSDRDDVLRRFQPEHNVVLEVDGTILARAVGMPMGHWFGGSSVASLGVAGVTVSPEARGHGFGTRIVQHLLDDAIADGIPLSSLYPATLPIYRTLGYGDAFHRNGFKASLAKLPDERDPTVTIREMRDADLALLMRTYDRFAAGSNGMLARDAAWWGDRVLNEANPFRYLAFRGDALVGWLIYGFEKAKDDWRQDLSARDLTWFDIGAARALLGVASLHRSTCRQLTWSAPLPEPLHTAQHDHAIELDFHFRAMLRLLDVPAALRARGYAPLTDAEVTVRVRDVDRPANEGPWRITVAKGEATVTASAEADAVVTVQALASIYAGLLSARDAVRTGGLEANRDTVDALEAMFQGPAPWLGDFF